ncbi:MAG: Flp pilus assembly protein CpaB [Kiritimatiellia bacterium]
MKQKLILVIALLCGLSAFLLTGAYLRRERDRIMSGVSSMYVLGADQNLPAGSVIKQSDIGKLLVFRRNVGDRAILPEHWSEIVGKRLLFNINRNEPILWSDIDVPYRAAAGLADMVNQSMRAISISVDAVSSVSGMVRPNDHVDIIGTFTIPSTNMLNEVEMVTLTVLQDVTVLATGQQMASRLRGGEREQLRSGYSTVTLEVTPREVELMVFAQSVKGRLALSLRNPSDVSFVTDLPPIDYQRIQEKLQELNMIRQRDIRHKKDI